MGEYSGGNRAALSFMGCPHLACTFFITHLLLLLVQLLITKVLWQYPSNAQTNNYCKTKCCCAIDRIWYIQSLVVIYLHNCHCTILKLEKYTLHFPMNFKVKTVYIGCHTVNVQANQNNAFKRMWQITSLLTILSYIILKQETMVQSEAMMTEVFASKLTSSS